jgi:hypothetical protein
VTELRREALKGSSWVAKIWAARHFDAEYVRMLKVVTDVERPIFDPSDVDRGQEALFWCFVSRCAAARNSNRVDRQSVAIARSTPAA